MHDFRRSLQDQRPSVQACPSHVLTVSPLIDRRHSHGRTFRPQINTLLSRMRWTTPHQAARGPWWNYDAGAHDLHRRHPGEAKANQPTHVETARAALRDVARALRWPGDLAGRESCRAAHAGKHRRGGVETDRGVEMGRRRCHGRCAARLRGLPCLCSSPCAGSHRRWSARAKDLNRLPLALPRSLPTCAQVRRGL